MTPPALPRAGSTLQRHALALAARGWHVFPCATGGKRPALPGNWQRLATTSRARIHRWWACAPFNIGIACGPSGLVVIDLDIRKRTDGTTTTGTESLRGLCQSHGQPYPDGTFTVVTPSGGIHLYFQAPAALIRNSAGRAGLLIDVRAAGGYVLAPGSQVGGRPYAVADASRPVPLPGWITELLSEPPVPVPEARRLPAAGIRQPASYALAALREEAARVAAARAGTRNDTLNRAAFSLGQLVAASLIPATTVTTALALAADSCGLPAGEARRTIRSGMASGRQQPRVPLSKRHPF